MKSIKKPALPVIFNEPRQGVRRPSANVKILGNNPDWLLVSEVTPRYWAVLAQEYIGETGYKTLRPCYQYRAFVYDSVTEKEELKRWTMTYATGIDAYQEAIELAIEFYGGNRPNT